MSDIVINHKAASASEVGYLLNRGVPENLFSTQIRLKNYLARCAYEDNSGKVVTTDVATQLKMYEVLKKNPLKGSPIIIISSPLNKRLAQVVALQFFRNAFKQYYKLGTIADGNSFRTQPYWYPVPSVWETVKDREDFKARIGRPCFIVLDGVYVDSPPNKIEKVRDLLDEHDRIPKVIVAAGGTPYELARTRLFVQPNFVFNLNRRE